MRQSHFDQSRHEWRGVKGELGRHDDTILGWDFGADTLDVAVRWHGEGEHGPIHRHTPPTTVLVLEGEQQLWDLSPDGSKGAYPVRRAGDHAPTTDEPLPHLECGALEGGLAFSFGSFGSHSNSGRLCELLDEGMNILDDVTTELLSNSGRLCELLDEGMNILDDLTMELLVEDWKTNT